MKLKLSQTRKGIAGRFGGFPLSSKRYGDIDFNIILIVIIVGISVFFGCWDFSSQSLIAHDEGLYAGRAKLILESDNWFTPFGYPHYKTLGSYWIIALSFKLFGY